MWVDGCFMDEGLCFFLTRKKRKQIINRKTMKKRILRRKK